MQDEPGQGDKPSYVDEQVVADATLTKCTDIGNDSMLEVKIRLSGILQGLGETLRGAVMHDATAQSATGIAALIKDRLNKAGYPIMRVTRVRYSPTQ